MVTTLRSHDFSLSLTRGKVMFELAQKPKRIPFVTTADTVRVTRTFACLILKVEIKIYLQ